MAKIGCLALLALGGWLCLEAWVFLLVAEAVGERWFGSALSGILPVGIALLLLSWLGVKVAKHHGARVVAGLLTGTAGRHAVGCAGGILIAIPGPVLKLPGLVLLLPPVQALLGGLGQLVMAAVMRRQMSKMFPPGFPMPPGGASPFPGMAPFAGFKPDDRAPRRGPPKTIDTTAERT